MNGSHNDNDDTNRIMTMEKFNNKYRIPSIRLQNWDYRWAGAYFITICTHNRAHYFGEVVHGKMILSNVGVLADVLWHEIKNHAQNVVLGEFVVMPNHIHGVLVITKFDDGGDNIDGVVPVETGHALSLLSDHETIGQQRFQNIGKNSVSSIVGSYKSAVTKHARRLGYEFQWQTRFYENIIRNDESFQRINNYIMNNPAKWQEDRFFAM
jgi:putative transposase